MIADAGPWLTFLIAFTGLLGLLIGSFLNVVAYRVPIGASIVSPPSACPKCGARIKAYDNIPVLSWLVLRGRCRSCAAPVSVRYLVVEAATAVFFTGVAFWFAPTLGAGLSAGSAGAVLEFIAFLYLAAISVALTLIDIDFHRLPNAIVLPSYAVGAALLGAAGLLTANYASLIGAAIGGVSLFAFYLVLALAYPRGMGFGDVKLAGVLGLYLGYLGWGPLLVGAFAAFLVGGLFSIVLLLTRRVGRKAGIPFGPWMLAGAWIGVIFGKDIAIGYLALFGLN